MEFVNTLAAVIVMFAGVWLSGLAVAAIAKPDFVRQFFGKFASSAFAHFLEMFVRIVVGTAFVIYSPQMRFAVVFTVFGWMLIVSSVVLCFVPWKLHRRFADRSLPMLTNRMILFATVALLGGAIMIFSLITGPAAT